MPPMSKVEVFAAIRRDSRGGAVQGAAHPGAYADDRDGYLFAWKLWKSLQRDNRLTAAERAYAQPFHDRQMAIKVQPQMPDWTVDELAALIGRLRGDARGRTRGGPDALASLTAPVTGDGSGCGVAASRSGHTRAAASDLPKGVKSGAAVVASDQNRRASRSDRSGAG